jgi:RNA polymerase sigma-70 factor, ECF subfamily
VSIFLDIRGDTQNQLDKFLASIEQRAYRTALFTTKKSQDALDIVQDAMMQLIQNYRQNTASEWPLLFQRILQNKIMDWHRSQQKHRRFFWQLFATPEADDDVDFFDQIPDSDSAANPEALFSQVQSIDHVLTALNELPLRQRQAFLLRAWEEFDVGQTAAIMNCSSGSVKTHYFRAVQKLQEILSHDHQFLGQDIKKFSRERNVDE